MSEAMALSRRDFLRGRRKPKTGTIRPPGVDEANLQFCTGCAACAEICPTGIIAMADGRPYVDFSHGECSFCGECRTACPEPVFTAGEPLRFLHVAAIAGTCLAMNYVDCQACRDACPEQAIRFRPRIGGPFVPELDEDICTGCGGCISVCPAAAIAVREPVRGARHA